MKVVVTGAAGFIGCNATRRFLSQGFQVVGIDNLSRPGARQNLAWLRSTDGDLDFHEVDVRNRDDINRVLRSGRAPDLVLHCAGQVAVTTSVLDPIGDFEINALGTLNVLEATRLNAPEAVFIYSSTNKVYGALDDLMVTETPTRYQFEAHPNGVAEDQPLNFHSPYGCSKGCADQYVRDYARIYGLRTVVLRQSCIYGTRQFGIEDQGWVAWFVIATLLGRPLTIYGDGKQVRDVLWIDDLLDVFAAAHSAIDRVAGQVYNVGGGVHQMSLLELVDLIGTELGTPITPLTADWRPGDQRVFVSDTTKAQRELAWTPKIAPAEGVRRLLDWARLEEPLLRQVIG